MKRISLYFCLLLAAIAVPAGARGLSLNPRNNRVARSAAVKENKTDSIYESVSQQYANGKLSADSVISLALYHKVCSPKLTERCLKLVGDNPRGAMELGVLYAFSPEFARRASEGVKLLQAAAKGGLNEANCYLGFYYYNHRDYKKAKAYFDACNPIQYGFGYAALGGMYTAGNGVGEDLGKAREAYRNSSLMGYPRGMALYGFN
ncbi:MAG: hypothetical protein K2M11_10560, partial [Paramuribaculum sp.]|nr:hypothetical protein [Paramuribaculum sp.]